MVRALGRAWVEPDGSGGWRRKRGRAPEGVLTDAEAAARMLALMREHDEAQTLLERDAEERRRRGVTFRELAREYLRWLENVKSAKPQHSGTTGACSPSPARATDAAVVPLVA